MPRRQADVPCDDCGDAACDDVIVFIMREKG